MSHPPFLVSAPLLRHSDNKFISRDNGAPSALGISASLWGFPLRSGDFRFALGISALLWGFPLCSGDDRFALGISASALGMTASLWG